MITKMSLENFLFIDIETVSQQADFQLLDSTWQQLWQEKIERIVPENVSIQEYYPQRAGIMAEFAKVVCISIAYFKKENDIYQLRVKSIFNHDEKVLLQSFVQTINQIEAVHRQWSFTGHFTSLKLLAAALNIASPKDDIDGSMVGEVYWKENDLERIATYCQKDVVTVANIILRLKNLPLLEANQIIFVK
ncbi:MAG: 3'-5' exonuclease [Sphingobacteriales bacterium]|nr:3'-5' exonuclease [Sphingobacteriales bacterium]